MKEELEKMEAIEQVLESLVPKIVRIEERLPALLSHGKKMDQLLAEFELAKKEGKQEQLKQSVDELAKEVAGIPKVIAVKNHHHFEHKSRKFVIGLIIGLLVMVCSVGITVSVMLANLKQKEALEKYTVVRAHYPSVAAWVEAAYLADPKLADKAEGVLAEREELKRLMLEEKMAKAAYEELKQKRANQEKNRQKGN